MSSSSTKRHKYHKVQSAQTLPDSSPETHQKNKTIFTGFQNLLTSLSRPSINLEDANDSSFEKKNEYATSKARELKYNLQEWILMKSIVFSLVVFLVFVSLIHFLLNLAGSYLPVLILSLLTSIALRPTKDHFSFNIKKFFGLIHVQQQEKYFFKDSLIFFLWRTLNDLVHYKQNTQLTRKRRQRIAGFFKAFNPTGDIYAIITACVCWIIITRFGINIVLYILGILVILDFFIRLFLDFLVFLIDQFSWSRDIKLRIQKNKNFGLIIDSTVGTAVLLLFLILSIGSVIFVIFFLLSDIETIIINLRGAITLLIQNINKRVVQYSGIENAIDENFVISLMKTYNESINSFVEKHDLKGLYALFSGWLLFILSLNLTTGVLNSFRSDPSSSDSIKDFPGLVENQSQFEQCMIENRLNFNFSIARNLEALYCSILPYAKKLTVDPLTTVKKIQDGVSFVVQLLFGTILMEVFLISKAALDYMFNFVVFCFCVYYLLHANRSAINTVTSLLPFSPNVQTELNTSLVKSIKGSFLCSIKIFFYHFFFTWLIFDIFHLKLGFTISIAASVFSIIPFIPSWCFCLPHAIYFYIGENNLLSALVFPIAYLMVSNKVYNDIYRKSIDVHPYLTGLSIVMGIYAFDVQGIIYGPLLMCLIMIVIELVKKYGVSTTSMLQFYRKKVYLEQLDSLDKMAQNKEEKRRSRSFDSDRTPLSPHRPERF